MDGVFQTDDLSPTGYAKIVSFDENGYKVEPIEDYESGSYERIRYYYFSEVIYEIAFSKREIKKEIKKEIKDFCNLFFWKSAC